MLDILQKVFYRSNPAREAFVEMCESSYVQKMTFDSYLYKTGERPARLCMGPRCRAGLAHVVLSVLCTWSRACTWWGSCRHDTYLACSCGGLPMCRPVAVAWSSRSRAALRPPSPPAVVPGNPLDDVKLLVDTVGSLLRSNALRARDSKSVNVSFGSKSNEEKLQTAA